MLIQRRRQEKARTHPTSKCFFCWVNAAPAPQPPRNKPRRQTAAGRKGCPYHRSRTDRRMDGHGAPRTLPGGGHRRSGPRLPLPRRPQPPPGRLTGRRRSRGGRAPAPLPQGGQRGGSELGGWQPACRGAVRGPLHSEPGPDPLRQPTRRLASLCDRGLGNGEGMLHAEAMPSGGLPASAFGTARWLC